MKNYETKYSERSNAPTEIGIRNGNGKYHLTMEQKNVIMKYVDNHPNMSLRETARQISPLLNRVITAKTVSRVKRMLEESK